MILRRSRALLQVCDISCSFEPDFISVEWNLSLDEYYHNIHTSLSRRFDLLYISGIYILKQFHLTIGTFQLNVKHPSHLVPRDGGSIRLDSGGTFCRTGSCSSALPYLG